VERSAVQRSFLGNVFSTERSVGEGPAVLSQVLTHPLKSGKVRLRTDRQRSLRKVLELDFEHTVQVRSAVRQSGKGLLPNGQVCPSPQKPYMNVCMNSICGLPSNSAPKRPTKLNLGPRYHGRRLPAESRIEDLPFLSFCFVDPAQDNTYDHPPWEDGSALSLSVSNLAASANLLRDPKSFDFASLSLYYECLRSISFHLVHLRR
jgi:hypothetical protein